MKNNKRILITGGAGFIGHHLVEHLIRTTKWDIVVLDKLTYASNGLERLRDINCFNRDRVLVLASDFSRPLSEGVKQEIGKVDYIIHMGAESHVDRSIENPEPFIMSNVVGTMNMLNFARELKDLEWFNYFSTDEVYGSAPEGIFYKETDRYNCTNPYSASKAGAEQLCLAYENCYSIPLFISNTMNVFGERQHSEKFIPLTMNKVIKGEKVFIHSDKTKTVSGTRFYIHARNVASAVTFLLNNAESRQSYNIVGEKEVSNLDLAKSIARILNKPLDYEMIDFHSSRPGHDLRYALDGTKLNNMGWKLPITFEESLRRTIEWTYNNTRWLK